MKVDLKTKFLAPVMTVLIIGMAVSATVSYLNAKNIIRSLVADQIAQIADSAAYKIDSWVRRTAMDVETWCAAELYATSVKSSFFARAKRREADAQLARLKAAYGFYEGIYLADAGGVVVASSEEGAAGADVSEERFFKKAMAGALFISDAAHAEATESAVFTIAAPVTEKDEVTGVMYAAANLSALWELVVDAVKIGRTGYAYVYEKDGAVISHPDPSVLFKLNMNQFDFGREMIKRKEGMITYTWKGVEKIVAFRRCRQTGWTVGAGAPTAEMLAPVKRMGAINAAISAGVALFILWTILTVVRSVVRPLNALSARLTENAERVSAASESVAASSHTLAEGASEQASSIEEVSSSLEQLSAMTRQNALNAGKANENMGETNHIIRDANASMDELVTAMSDISRASEETSKIISTIDSIAFQTNLLALNAAVEAARAGEAGAGFSVVAGEVRNLAMNAAASARNTSDLIEETTKQIADGLRIVNATNASFAEVAEKSDRVVELFGEIAEASREQAQGLEQINKAVTAMDRVVQQVAANAEESASAAEEMTVQSAEMKDAVGGIVYLVKGDRGGRGQPAAPRITQEKRDAPKRLEPGKRGVKQIGVTDDDKTQTERISK